MSLFERLKHAFQLYHLLAKDPRTPKIAKFLPWLSILYLLWPIDFIPDAIPILGQIDDALMIPPSSSRVSELNTQDRGRRDCWGFM